MGVRTLKCRVADWFAVSKFVLMKSPDPWSVVSVDGRLGERGD